MINERVYLFSSELVLVPYLAPFVPRYHEWMSDPELLAATESEPLSLEEEYENQVSWLHSVDKMTFILLAPIHDSAAVAASSSKVGPPKSAGDHGHDAALVSLQDSFPSDVMQCASSEVITAAAGALPALSHFTIASGSSPSATAPAYTGSIVENADDVSFTASGTSSLVARFRPSRVKNLFDSRGAPEAVVVGDAYAEGLQTEQLAHAQSYVMIGDCNLFLLGDSENIDECSTEDATCQEDLGSHAEAQHDNLNRWGASQHPDKPLALMPSRTFEVEVMVADTQFRRLGLAETAVRMIMQYAVAVCGATRFVAKILDSNTGSIELFTKKLKFQLFKEVKVFHEIHFARSLRTAEERRVWDLECKGRLCESKCLRVRTVECRKDPAENEAGRATVSLQPAQALAETVPLTYWCAPLTLRVASGLKIWTRRPSSEENMEEHGV